MVDQRPSLSNWLNLTVTQCLNVAGTLSQVQVWCSTEDMDMCIEGAEKALEQIDEARERLRITIECAKANSKPKE